jgi:type I restriction enzyme S subunit
MRMSEQDTKGLVPVLRFPQFQDEGKWEVKKLGELISTITPPKKLLTTDYLPDGQYPIIDQSQSNVCGWTNDDHAVIEEHLPLIVFGDHTCILKLVDQPFAQGADGIKIIKPNNSVQTEFLYQSLQFKPLVMEQYKRHFSTLRERKVAYPDRKTGEQQQIADCLTSVDDLITTQTQKLVALKTYKKGLLQQLLPAEGETVPKLRFPEFATAWNKTKIGKIVDLLSGYAFKSEYFVEQGTKLLTPKNFTKDGYASFNKDNTKYTTEIVDEKYSCIEGDLLLLLTDLTPSCELLGRPLLLTKHDGAVLLNQRIVKVIPKDAVEIRFLQYFFITEPYIKRIRETASGSTVRHSSNKIISTTDVYLPTRLEQQKIADCLAAIDDFITAQTKKLDVLKTHKKGLMQQLFPNPELSNL